MSAYHIILVTIGPDNENIGLDLTLDSNIHKNWQRNFLMKLNFEAESRQGSSITLSWKSRKLKIVKLNTMLYRKCNIFGIFGKKISQTLTLY